MTTLERPFDALLMQQLVFKVVHGQLPDMPDDKYSTELIKLMTNMLDKNSEKRESAENILKNSIFNTSLEGAGSKPIPKSRPATKEKSPAKPKQGRNVFEQSSGETFLEVFQKARGITDIDNSTDSQEVGELLKSLSKLVSERHKKEDEKLSPILAATHIEVNIKADKYSDKNKDINKTIKGKTGPKESSSKNTTLTPQNVHRKPFNDSYFIRIYEQQQRNHNRIRNLVEPPRGASGIASCSSSK
ncbi:hypothetical protein KUTeg_020288 [Tegillarca granosa]|uniref:non-specific serine/threonine protein kinase n=1 Tax=Tegillarca granosa TaxID=220873 RepID=A0ABQ9EBU7_TEGGR|nr:hypothetical protein KUTeg_020288 [Tegillarca granosa]